MDLTLPRTVALKAGESRTFTLRLSRGAEQALRTRRAVAATVSATPLDRSRPATAHRITVRR